jgi:phosphonopyruvate decarboxylase
MKASSFVASLEQHGITFFAGVPDSLLKPFCDEIFRKYGNSPSSHFIAHNEGGAVGFASGVHLSTGKLVCVYMQNSGIGNAINPITSLTSPLVYGIPILYIVGWRGKPGIKDEPQHKFQGIVSEKLLKTLDIEVFVLADDTSEAELNAVLSKFQTLFSAGKSAAFLVESGALSGDTQKYTNQWLISRENAIERIIEFAVHDITVTSTGKISRELFEARERNGQSHGNDFLTVGSMGHDSMIALGIAVQKPDRNVWCIQGDGAFIMHMGAIAEIGTLKPRNLRYVVLNNAAHESVGGMPTCANTADLAAIAAACGIENVHKVVTMPELEDSLAKLKSSDRMSFLEVQCASGSRKDLGRPTTTPQENKLSFMENLSGGEANA